MTLDVHPTSGLQGLTEKEVLKRRNAGQGNNVTLETSRSYSQILQENLFTFINAVFFTLSVIMAVLKRYGDSVLVIVVIFGGVLVNICQEIWAKRKLDEICDQVKSRLMPLPSYLWIHWGAKLSDDEIKILCDWANAENAKIAE